MNPFLIFGATYLIVLPVIVFVLFFIKLSRVDMKKTLKFSVITLPLAFIIGKIANHFYINPRPFVIEHFQPLIEHAADNGFPSDHTLLAGSIAAIIWYINKPLGNIFWIIAILIGISRIAVGVHHPIDIIGSLVIAYIAGFVAHTYLKDTKNKADVL